MSTEEKNDDDRLGIAGFVDKDVVLQLKQPYQYQAVRLMPGCKTGLLLFKEDNGRLSPADQYDRNAIPIAFGFLVGKLKRRTTGHFYMEVPDETTPGARVEVAIHPDLIAFVSLAHEPSTIILS